MDGRWKPAGLATAGFVFWRADVKIYISADMEGITGVTCLRQVSLNDPAWADARIWMTEDVNAAVEGAYDAGATEVLVRDAHGPATNILPDRLHPRCRLIAGWSPVVDMLQGLDDSYDLAFFVGYHPGPGVPGAVLSHTYSMSLIRDVFVNGVTAGESLINAVQAGVHGVPVGLVTGERSLREEIARIGEAEFVETKVGHGYQTALLEPLAECRARIREAAARAVRRHRDQAGPGPYGPELPVRARVELQRAEAVLAARLVPGVQEADSRSVEFESPTAEAFVRTFLLLTQVLYGLKL